MSSGGGPRLTFGIAEQRAFRPARVREAIRERGTQVAPPAAFGVGGVEPHQLVESEWRAIVGERRAAVVALRKVGQQHAAKLDVLRTSRSCRVPRAVGAAAMAPARARF